ncbi:hypothetical protein OBBRIDRAFT_792329 [Obba rivulosa]|uniref:Uncharacterized protein n=1 Tax=Obba rivulosa TaxID=1052685 RepID=A0A8E2B011_9APHY|nr:hypothetical protein OBBRIDRAFT_792329 [Obba rivulosa]
MIISTASSTLRSTPSSSHKSSSSASAQPSRKSYVLCPISSDRSDPSTVRAGDQHRQASRKRQDHPVTQASSYEAGYGGLNTGYDAGLAPGTSAAG